MSFRRSISKPYYEWRLNAAIKWSSFKQTIKNNIHLVLFETYINNPGTWYGNLIGVILPKKDGDAYNVHFWIPKLWIKKIVEQLKQESQLFPEVNFRITSGDSLVMPQLTTQLGGNPYSQMVIPTKNVAFSIDFEMIAYKLTICVSILTLVSTNIAERIDRSIFASSTTPDNGIESVFSEPQITDSQSEGMTSIGGYVQSSEDSLGDVWKMALFHLPRGYRQKAKFFMHPRTGKNHISKIYDGEGNSLVDLRPNSKSIDEDNRLVSLLGKVVVNNEYMDSKEFYGVLADLTRGYTIAINDMAFLTINNTDGYKFNIGIAGRVIQPASFKAIRV